MSDVQRPPLLCSTDALVCVNGDDVTKRPPPSPKHFTCRRGRRYVMGVARGGGATRVGEAPNAGSWAAGPCAPGPGPGAGTAGMHRRYRYGGRAGETAHPGTATSCGIRTDPTAACCCCPPAARAPARSAPPAFRALARARASLSFRPQAWQTHASLRSSRRRSTGARCRQTMHALSVATGLCDPHSSHLLTSCRLYPLFPAPDPLTS